MHWLDWSVIALYMGMVTLIGFLFVRKANASVADYFVAGRSLPWWLAGTSLVATSFAADTPLFVAGLLATKGIAGNWIWWNQAIAWALAIVFFARLWRRSGVTTDAEFIELRYGGKSGAFLRGFRALFMSAIVSTCTLAWVMLAMQKIVQATLARPEWVESLQLSIEQSFDLAPGAIDLWKWTVLVSLFLIATFYTVLAGFWGIVVTDLVQFVIAIVGAIVFAFYALDSVGGMTGLQAGLLEEYGPQRVSDMLRFFPEFVSLRAGLSFVVVYFSMLWWTDCNGYAAQRMFSTRDERQSTLASLWFSIAHFALRPWPWIVVGLVALVQYPGLEDPETGYPKLLMEIMPPGLKGMLVASLLAAFMSTVDTHLNWNASYFVTDIYKRFLVPDADEAKCLQVSRMSVLVYAVMAIVVAYFMTSIESGVLIFFNLTSSIGLVLILRWFWWRVNAWSEISAMIASVVFTTMLPIISDRYDLGWSFETRILLTVALVTPTWLVVTLLTAPVEAKHLDKFYRGVQPPDLWWGPVAARCPEVLSQGGLVRPAMSWVSCAVMLYALLFTIGNSVLLQWSEAAVSAAVVCIASLTMWKTYPRS
ncbi:sodium:solute symporter family protein [Adhaeretor mobilis]|uniref:Sodium/glucose cotransporter n=1 Tax=Adhaeretor mobilis TaxID=1930276 RepID=A0A517MQ58_9BACT|nr:sodium:solute symporter family protein [Adhaeretor mobilis]QDS96917.1 Sodium/glucose cotransporter [Adhaeretor mobilis]